MLKYYLYRSSQIPTSVHPFVKQEAKKQTIRHQLQSILSLSTPPPISQSRFARIMAQITDHARKLTLLILPMRNPSKQASMPPSPDLSPVDSNVLN